MFLDDDEVVDAEVIDDDPDSDHRSSQVNAQARDHSLVSAFGNAADAPIMT